MRLGGAPNNKICCSLSEFVEDNNNMWFKLQFFHNTGKQDTDSSPIFPAPNKNIQYLSDIIFSFLFFPSENLHIYHSLLFTHSLIWMLKSLYLYMGAWKLRCTKCFLSLVPRFAPRDTQDKSCLIPSCSCRCYSIAIIPSSVDAFTWIEKIKLHNLCNEIN